MAATSAPSRRRVDGVLLLDKPQGLSSNAALQRAKRLYAAEKAGHTGTLDPLASGLLPVCFGDATKFAQLLLDARKEYVATLCFGTATTTGDAEGQVIAQRDVAVSRDAFEQILPRFIGTIAQVPPRYSALKFEGLSHYRYARAGIEVPRAPRTIEIHSIDVALWNFPSATLRVACGKGTYIRTLVEDLAIAVGSCAYLAALSRTAAGPFTLDRAVTLDQLGALDATARDSLLLPVYSPLAGIARLDVDADGMRALFHGRAGSAETRAEGRYRCFGPGEAFIGLVEIGGGEMRPLRLVRAPVFGL